MPFISDIIRDSGVSRPTLASTLIALGISVAFGAGGILIFTSQFCKDRIHR